MTQELLYKSELYMLKKLEDGKAFGWLLKRNNKRKFGGKKS